MNPKKSKRETYVRLLNEAIDDLDSNRILSMRMATNWKWAYGKAPDGFSVSDVQETIERFRNWCLSFDFSYSKNWSVFSHYSAGFWLAVQDNKKEGWMRVAVGWGPTGGDQDEGTEYERP